MGQPKMSSAFGVKLTVAALAAVAATVGVSGTCLAAGSASETGLAQLLSSKGATESQALDQIATRAANAMAQSMITSGQGTANVAVRGFKVSKWTCEVSMSSASVVGDAGALQSAPWQFGVAEVSLPNSTYTVNGQVAVAIVYAMGATTPVTPPSVPVVPTTVPTTTVPPKVPVTPPTTVPVTPTTISSSTVNVPATVVTGPAPTHAASPKHVVPKPVTNKPSLHAPTGGLSQGEELLGLAAVALLVLYFAKKERRRPKHAKSWFHR